MDEFLKMLKAHIGNLHGKERLAYLVRLLWHSTYSWGHEVIGGTDCSGTVCFALYLMGYNIRVTANDIFTLMTVPRSLLVPEPGDLIFWHDPDGKRVVHVAVFSDHDVIMNAGDQIEDRTWKSMQIDQTRIGRARYDARALDFNKCAALSEKGKYAWDVDAELKPLLGIFKEA